MMVSVMVVEAIGMRNKRHINAVGRVDDQSALALRVVSDLELGFDILQRENVCDCVGVKLDITVVLDMSLHVGGEIVTVTVDSHSGCHLSPIHGKQAWLELQNISTVDWLSRRIILRRSSVASEIGCREESYCGDPA